MKEVEIAYTSDSGFFSAAVDGKKLSFMDKRTKCKVPEGVKHALQWFVRGEAGDGYSIKITKPPEAKFEHKATLDGDRKDAGLHWFEVKEQA